MTSISSVSPTPTTTTTVAASTTSTASSSQPAGSVATGGDGTGAVATQVMQWASIVADGSGASAADKATAFAAINAAITQGAGAGPNDYFAQTTLSQRQSVANIIDNSSFAKQSYSAAQSFAARQTSLNVTAEAKGGDVDPSNSMLSRLNQLSADQQQLVFAGLGGGFQSLDAWKAQLQKDQDTMAAQYAADNPGSSVTVTLSDAAKKAVAASAQASGSTSTTASVVSATSTTTDPNTQALQTLTSKSPVTSADAGLAVLQNAAQAKAAADAQGTSEGSPGSSTSSSTDSEVSDKPYQAGSRVSVKA